VASYLALSATANVAGGWSSSLGRQVDVVAGVHVAAARAYVRLL